MSTGVFLTALLCFINPVLWIWPQVLIHIIMDVSLVKHLGKKSLAWQIQAWHLSPPVMSLYASSMAWRRVIVCEGAYCEPSTSMWRTPSFWALSTAGLSNSPPCHGQGKAWPHPKIWMVFISFQLDHPLKRHLLYCRKNKYW